MCPLGHRELGSTLRFTCRNSYKSLQENRWQICSMTLVSSTGGTSKTWVPTAWRSSPLAALSEALGTLERTGVLYLHGVRGYHPPAQQGTAFLKAKMGITQTMQSAALKLQNLLTSRTAMTDVTQTWCLTEIHMHLSFLPKSEVRFSISTRLVSHIIFLLAFKLPGIIQNKVIDWCSAAKWTTFAVLF